jgi:hypothetical protein
VSGVFIYQMKKVKIDPVHAMKAWGGGGVAYSSTQSWPCTRLRLVVSFMPWPHYILGKGPPVPIELEVVGPRVGVGMLEKKEILPLLALSPWSIKPIM